MSDGSFSIFLAGDAIITAPWSHITDPDFEGLIDQMRQSDATILNLETVIHTFKGYAQADSGGTWLTSSPKIAQELAWAGVDMVSHANNHAFDYGSEGILETLHYIDEAGIILSGSGCDLQNARAPQYFDAPKKRIAHVSMASSFVPYGKASKSRPDMRGRPGINPLETINRRVVTVAPAFARQMRNLDKKLGKNTDKYFQKRFKKFGVRFEIGKALSLRNGKRPIERDEVENLNSIAQAAQNADLTVVSIHSHDQSRWLGKFIRKAISAGADVVLVHGVHEVRGIEIMDGKPVFYGLGDFVYQTSQIERLPSEAYDNLGLDENSKPSDIAQDLAAWSLTSRRETFEGCAARLRFSGNSLEEVILLPVDLQYGGDKTEIGRPRLAGSIPGKRIIAQVAKMSEKLGTRIKYDEYNNIGILNI